MLDYPIQVRMPRLHFFPKIHLSCVALLISTLAAFLNESLQLNYGTLTQPQHAHRSCQAGSILDVVYTQSKNQRLACILENHNVPVRYVAASLAKWQYKIVNQG